MPWSLVRLFVGSRGRRRARGPIAPPRVMTGPTFDPVLAAFERESG
jgi:hypothetical protein